MFAFRASPQVALPPWLTRFWWATSGQILLYRHALDAIHYLGRPELAGVYQSRAIGMIVTGSAQVCMLQPVMNKVSVV